LRLALSRSVMYHRNTLAAGIAPFPRAVGGMELANFDGPAGSLCRLIHVMRQVGAQLPSCSEGKTSIKRIQRCQRTRPESGKRLFATYDLSSK
jgi:hypothetical protein